MKDEQLIDHLFETARQEPPTRSLESVTQFVQSTLVSTPSGLILKWLKQNKMNMLISTSGMIITATILLFPKQEANEENVIANVQDSAIEVLKPKETVSEPTEEQLGDQTSQIAEVREPMKEVVKELEEPTGSKGQVNANPTTSDSINTNGASQRTEPSLPTHQLSRTASNESKEAAIVSSHSIVLVSKEGKSSVEAFDRYILENLSQLSPEFTSKTSKKEIKKFTLKLDNQYKADFRMVVSGFDQLELNWDVNEEGEVKNMWYRLDAKEVKELDFAQSCEFSIRVKHIHEEF